MILVTSKENDATKPNRRPHDVASLLYAGEIGPAWAYANRSAQRFYVVNVESVLGRLYFQHTKARAYFDRAAEIIYNETTWPKQFPFDYQCSHTQIYPDKIRTPKTFGRAAAIIVAIEMAAADQMPDLNVYDYLRILPAQYFIDRFTESRLQELEGFHSKTPPEQRTALFGPNSYNKSFHGLCAEAITQRESVLQEIAEGYCVTKYTAEKLVKYINLNFPSELHVGPIVSAGEDSIEENLGVKGAAPSLLVPRNLPPEDLTPIN